MESATIRCNDSQQHGQLKGNWLQSWRLKLSMATRDNCYILLPNAEPPCLWQPLPGYHGRQRSPVPSLQLFHTRFVDHCGKIKCWVWWVFGPTLQDSFSLHQFRVMTRLSVSHTLVILENYLPSFFTHTTMGSNSLSSITRMFPSKDSQEFTSHDLTYSNSALSVT